MPAATRARVVVVAAASNFKHTIPIQMKSYLLVSALAAVLTLFTVGVPVHAQAAAPATTAPATSSKKIPYKGTISAIDTTANTVTIKTSKGDMVMAVNESTKYKGGKSLADFAVGDAVTGSYMKDDSGKMMAASIHKAKTKAPAPAAQ
jgi:subtilisin family serine protease